jgi:hypothetical protein
MARSKAAARFKLRALVLAIAPLLACSVHAEGEEARIRDLEDKLAHSMELIQQLSQRVNQLEAQQSARTAMPAAAPAATPSTAPAATDTGGTERMARMDMEHMGQEAGIPLHGFSDVGYYRRTRAVVGQKGGFFLGNLDLYLTPTIGDRVKSIFELNFEYGADSPELGTDLERIQFGYTFSDAATLWAGRFHTPYGYWNTAFHHGAQMQTAVTRPRFIDFEDNGGILPSHGVGVMLSGNVKAAAGRVGYDAYVANGDRILNGTLDINAVGDNDRNKLVGGNLRYSFGGALSGLTLGVHAFTENVAGFDANDALLSKTRVNVAGGFAVYDENDWEVIAEYYHFRNKDLLAGSGIHASNAAFAQVGYLLAGRWTPYLRLERASLDQSDAYFANQDSGRSYTRQVAGLRYDLNPSTALKLELDRLHQNQTDGSLLRSNGLRFQFAIRF